MVCLLQYFVCSMIFRLFPCLGIGWDPFTRVTSPPHSTSYQKVPVLLSILPSLVFPFYVKLHDSPCRMFLLYFLWIPCHFYLVCIEKQREKIYIVQVSILTCHYKKFMLSLNKFLVRRLGLLFLIIVRNNCTDDVL